MADSFDGDFPALSPQQKRRRLGELAWVFFRLGTTAFGGPAAHVALMNQEIVERRRWLTQQELLDLMGLANLIPGPNSTELAIHIGYARGKDWGLWVAGVCFILPAMALVWMLAALYVHYQTLPQLEGFMYGVKPVIIAVILQALWKLGQKALKNRLTWGAALAALSGYFLGWPEIALLLILGVGVMLLGQGVKQWGQMGFFLPLLFAQTSPPPSPPSPPAALPGAGSVFLFFLKIGAVLYGSGYVLLAFLQRELVEQNSVAHPPTTPRRSGHWSVHPGARFHHRHLYRLSTGRKCRRRGGNPGHFSTRFCLGAFNTSLGPSPAAVSLVERISGRH
jgi:chromate transporter